VCAEQSGQLGKITPLFDTGKIFIRFLTKFSAVGRTFFVPQPPLRSASQKRVQSYAFFYFPPNFLHTFSEKNFTPAHSPLSLSRLQSDFFEKNFRRPIPGTRMSGKSVK
ncbi:MAG: hypothetical protein J6B44_02005, partial [Muribaculaceae bacterium]|nr:hypothetical protein [Muribaculaceae bacterium]